MDFVRCLHLTHFAYLYTHTSRTGSLGNEIAELPSTWQQRLSRKLLRFTVGITNNGPDDLQVSRQDNPEWFEWGDCHRHWHFKDFTNYELLDQATNGQVVTGRKQAFCLMDIRRMDANAGPSQYTCSNQGITAGWADIYSYTLDGQWIDITGVPSGTYTLRVTVNFAGNIPETDYGDNTVIVASVIIPDDPTDPPPTSCSNPGTVCSTNEDCCSTICHHESSGDKTLAEAGIRRRALAETGGVCICMASGEECGADHDCCSNKCRNFSCKGN